jgi:hypothetical protein
VIGHTATRAAGAAGLNPTYVREVAAGRVPKVRQVRQAFEDVYGEWWDKTPSGDTAAQRAAAGGPAPGRAGALGGPGRAGR